MRKRNDLIGLGLNDPKTPELGKKPYNPNSFINSEGAVELFGLCGNILLIVLSLPLLAGVDCPKTKKYLPFHVLLLMMFYGPFSFRKSISGDILAFFRCFSGLSALKKGLSSGDLFSFTKIFFAAFILIFLMDWHYWPYFFVPITSIVGVQVGTVIYRSFKKPSKSKGARRMGGKLK